MYRRDLITAEIQKLAQVLARIMGLKLEGNITEADDIFAESLQNDFGISLEDLFSADTKAFENLLQEKGYPAEKLEMLSQFLYSKFNASVGTTENQSFAEKLSVIYVVLESKYHVINMTNLDRQRNILHYLNT